MSQPCESYRKMFNEFIDQELTKEQCQELEQHLSQCPGCRKELELLKFTCQAISILESPSLPANFLGSIRQKLAQESISKRSGWESASRWLIAHPSVLALSFMGFFVFAFLLGRFTPSPQVSIQVAELEPVKAWEGVRESQLTLGQAQAPGGYFSTDSVRSGLPLTMVSYSAEEVEAPVIKSEIKPRLILQTPTQLIMNIIKNDPAFKTAQIYPIQQGVVAQTKEWVYRISISDANFINALALISEKRVFPTSLSEAEKLFALEIEKLPSPLAPAKE